MLKKSIFLSVFMMIIALFNWNTFADSIGYDISETSGQFLADLEINANNETEEVNDYYILGYAKTDDIRVETFIKKDGEYERFSDINGNNSWSVDYSGVFSIKVKMPYSGADNVNSIKVAVFKKSDEVKILGDNLQVSKFPITVYEKEEKDKINNSNLNIDKIKDIVDQMFEKPLVEWK